MAPSANGKLRPPPLVGVVGCGRVGGEVLRGLLALGWPPHQLAACSRNEARLAPFRAAGVQCVAAGPGGGGGPEGPASGGGTGDLAQWDASRAGIEPGGVRVLVLAVPQAQLRAVAAALNGAQSRSGPSGLGRCLVVSCAAGVGYPKLRQLLPRAPFVARTLVSLGRLPVLCPWAEAGDGALPTAAAAALPSAAFLLEAGHQLGAGGHALRLQACLEGLFRSTGSPPTEVRPRPRCAAAMSSARPAPLSLSLWVSRATALSATFLSR